MAALLSQTTLSSIRPAELRPCRHLRRRAAFHAPRSSMNKHEPLSLPKLQSFTPSEELKLTEQAIMGSRISCREERDGSLTTAKLLAVAEAAADRAEMHAIIGEQRNNWSHLFLHSINSLALTASLMAGLADIAGAGATLPLNLSSALLLSSAAGIMLVVNKIQPSQLAEEQRNAARLFKQLERSIRATLGTGGGAADEADVEEGLEKVLALQKAYPLPLLPGMLEKFPEAVEPAKWWPELRPRRQKTVGRNGWRRGMEQEMGGVLRVLKAKDVEQYVTFGQLVLRINKILAFAGPLLAGLAAAAAAASSAGLMHGSLPAAVGGALAAVANTLEHGGQVGMVFELSRNCAGFYRRLEEEIEFNLGEEEQMREQGELFELKTALQLGRSIAELRDLASAAASAGKDEEMKDFAGKLF